MLLIICSYIADLIFGDPEWFPHPVRGMGRLINFLDNKLRGGNSKEVERIKGTMTGFIVVGASVFFAQVFIGICRALHPLLWGLALVYLGYTTLAIKDLRFKAKAILREVQGGSIIEARSQLSKIVGRDTHSLSMDEIIRATVESIAENINDGIIAPLFYLILGGPVLAIAYKSINTLDSMLGYRNKKYLYFGWFSAKLDDIVNFIPARITGILISISCLKPFKEIRQCFEAMQKQGRKHPSPNSGLPEAAMAVLLGIRLGGLSTYEGKPSKKPYLGEDKTPITTSLINQALSVSFRASLFMVSAGVLVEWII